MIDIRAIAQRFELLRYEDPKAALELCRQEAETSDPENSPIILGEWASALRLLGRLAEAKSVLRLAGRVVKLHGAGQAVLGDLKQRRAGLEAYSGSFFRAFETVKQAIIHHTAAQYSTGIGRSFGDQGFYFYVSGRYEEGLVSLAFAERYLEDQDCIPIFAARINSALCLFRLDRGQEARALLELASEMPEIPATLMVQCRWAKAEAELGTNDDVAEVFEVIADHFREREEYPQMALANCQLVQAHLAVGRFEEACKVGVAMAALLTPLAKDKITSAAILNIARSSLTAKANLEAVLIRSEKVLRKAAQRPTLQ